MTERQSPGTAHSADASVPSSFGIEELFGTGLKSFHTDITEGICEWGDEAPNNFNTKATLRRKALGKSSEYGGGISLTLKKVLGNSNASRDMCRCEGSVPS